ncbi:MAG: SOS response-associated peptidase [Polyangiaceae bacterium]
MCGRYKLSEKAESVYEFFDIHGEVPLLFRPRYNIAPTDPIAVMRKPHQLEMLRWGIKIPNPKAGGFNVRVESLGAPFYRDSIQGRRCVIVADGYYEWKPLVEAKKPYLIKREDGQLFTFAGMWDRVIVKGVETDAATILTTKPVGVAAQAHDRMPVILPHDRIEQWLDPNARYRDLLEPDAEGLELVAVSSHVNSVKNDDPRCAEPLHQ